MTLLADNVRTFPDSDAPEARPLPVLRTIAASSLAGRPVPERPWFVRDLIPDRAVTMLSGDGGAGKSLLATQLGVASATATGWAGALPEPGPVAYLSAEDEEDEVHRRLADITAAAGLSLEDLSNFHLVPQAGKDAVLAVPGAKSDLLEATPLWSALVDKVRVLRPRLLVLDNLADIFAGNENSRPQARQFVGLLRGLAIERKLAVLVISHPSLTGLSSGTGTSGSTAWSNSVRSRLYLDRARDEGGEEPDPDLRILRLMKANYSPIGAEIRMRWERGRFKLETGGAGSFDRMAARSKAEAVFLDLLRAFQDQGRDVSPNVSNSFAPAVFAKHPDAAGITRRVFADAMNRLFTAGTIKSEKVGPQSKQKVRIIVAG